MPDFQLFNHVSLFALQPLTQAATDWIDENIDSSAQRFGGQVIIEPRYLEPILIGIEEAGLTFNQDPLFR